ARAPARADPLFACTPGRALPGADFTGKRAPERAVATVSPMRAPALAALAVTAAVIGGGAAVGIGRSAGWLDQGAKTVVVRAQAPAPVALPAAATSTVPGLAGRHLSPERIVPRPYPGVVYIRPDLAQR